MTDTHSTEHASHDDHHVHVVPMKVLIGIFVILLILTWATVAVWFVDLGPANIWVAMGIAVVKASLVALYFMHLRYDSPFNGVILIGALVFVALFVAVAMLDSHEYDDTRLPFEQSRKILNPDE